MISPLDEHKDSECGCGSSGAGEPDRERVSRRNFLTQINKLFISGVLAAHGWIVMRFLVTPGLEETPTQIPLGKPDEIPQGLQYNAEAKIFLVHREDQIQAISAKCTHLGCVLEYVDGENEEFHCPCHNSKFNRSGQRIAGPAQKSLERYLVRTRSEDGQLIVDFSRPVDADTWFSLG